MTTQAPLQAPPAFPGSLPEFLVYRELERRGLQDGVDFTFQSPLMGGRLQRGGAIVDFLFNNPPDLGISVLGTYYHYGLGSASMARDLMQRAQLAGQGINLVFIDEDDIMQDVRYYVGEALNYRDHSRMAKGV